MRGHGLSREQMQQALDAVAVHGNVTFAARAAGLARSTLQNRYDRALQAGLRAGEPHEPEETSETAPEPTPLEIRDANFWRQKASEYNKACDELRHALNELMGVRNVPIAPPQWLVETSQSKSRAVMAGVLSDLHCGEVVKSGEIAGCNAYDVEIFRRRLRCYINALCNIGPRWLADCEPMGCFLPLNGDLISGDIHDELKETNALTSHDQVQECVAELETGLRTVADTFGRVHVPVTPGNHGRTTRKPPSKQLGALSYDTLIGAMLQDRFRGDNRVTFDVAAGSDVVTNVLGWNILTTHGDKIGTGGGQGFVGPLLPIARGAQKVRHQYAGMGKPIDLILTGHFHTSSQPGPHLANGSMVGYAEYPNGIRCSVEPPQQWAFVIHERWMLRDRAEIKLEDPVRPEKPRVRIMPA